MGGEEGGGGGGEEGHMLRRREAEVGRVMSSSSVWVRYSPYTGEAGSDTNKAVSRIS